MAIKKEVVTGDDLGEALGIDPVAKKVNVLADGTTIRVNSDNKLEAVNSGGAGLDCDAIDQLPEVAWKKGTVVLAKQDGQCVRLTALESIFQEVGVGITANKVTAFTDDSFDVVVTVTNTGEGKNDLTNLVINKPNGGGYTLQDIREAKQSVDSFDKTGELSYDIKGLASGGTFTVRFKVVPSEAGTFQFTAAVNPNTSLDLDGKNNTATLILSAQTKRDNTYVPSVDCPLITATELDHNTVLVQAVPLVSSSSTYVTLPDTKAMNVFAERRTLKGLRIKLDGASTVIGYATNGTSGFYSLILSNGTTSHGAMVYGDDNNVSVKTDANAEKTGSAGFTFANGVLEITADTAIFAFCCRPTGTNCKWQTYKVLATVPTVSRSINVTNAAGCTTKKAITYKAEDKPRSDSFERVQVIPSSVTVDRSRVIQPVISKSSPASADDKLIITVRAGTAATVEFTSTDNYADVATSQGKTAISAGRVTVAADAKSTDSVNTKYIQVIVED